MGREWQQLTLLTSAPPPLSPFQIKKPATFAQYSDCFVQRQAAFTDKSFKRSFYNALARYNEDWPPLPATSPMRATRKGKKPIPLEQRRWMTF